MEAKPAALKAGRANASAENQMFTPAGFPFRADHWAYMVQTRPGRPGWNSLPVAGVSVPEFLSNGQGTGPQPIGT